jgi:hypothetical protein
MLITFPPIDRHHPQGQQIEEWEISAFESEVAKFENLLEYDLSRQHVYAVEKVGIFDTDDLIDHADDHLPVNVRSQLSPKTITDFQAAGRCLAFRLFTASGYHALRALEAEARKFHKLVLNQSVETSKNLGPLIDELRDKLESEERTRASDSPLGLIITNLARMNKIYRQPLTHPDMVIASEDDAREIFNLVATSLTLMRRNLVDRKLIPVEGSVELPIGSLPQLLTKADLTNE